MRKTHTRVGETERRWQVLKHAFVGARLQFPPNGRLRRPRAMREPHRPFSRFNDHKRRCRRRLERGGTCERGPSVSYPTRSLQRRPQGTVLRSRFAASTGGGNIPRLRRLLCGIGCSILKDPNFPPTGLGPLWEVGSARSQRCQASARDNSGSPPDERALILSV